MSSISSPVPLNKFENLLLIPTTINIKELVESANLYSKDINSNKLLSLISLIVTKTCTYDYDNDRYYSHKKQNIHSGELKKCCGNNYRIYFDFLYDSEILSTRSPFNKDIKGETFGYGFTSNYSFSRLKPIIINNLTPVEQKMVFGDSYVEKYDKILYKLFDRTKFSIDFNLAEEGLFEKYLGKVAFPLDSNSTIDWRKYSAYHGALKQLVKFVNGKYKFSRKKKPSERKPSGRFQSPLALLNKVTRNLLYYQGNKLRQLDVKNMFPYLLSQYLFKIATLDSQRIDRLQKCSAFNAKYKLKYSATDYLSKDWLEKHIKNKFETLFSSKPILEFTNRSLLKNSLNKYFFLDKPKSLFQNRVKHLQYSNKKFYSPFLYSSQNVNQNQAYNNLKNDYWKLKNKIEAKKSICTNSYFITKSLYNNSNLVTLYTETYKSLKIIKNLNPLQKDYSIYISTKTIENLMNKEINKFNTLSIEGIIYDYFIAPFMSKVTLIEWAMDYEKLFNENYNYEPEQDRALTKKLFISMLYAQNNHYIKQQEVFKSEFPILYDLIREKKKGDHKIITHELFNVEAEIIVDTVARNLIKQSIPTFTIHDCIAVKEESTEISKLEMEDAFLKKFGNCPKIKKE